MIAKIRFTEVFMRSKQLLEKLTKELGNAYAIHKKTGISTGRLSTLKNKDNVIFSARELLDLKNAGLITKSELLKISFADRLKDDDLMKHVACYIVALPVMQIAVQEVVVYARQCILC